MVMASNYWLNPKKKYDNNMSLMNLDRYSLNKRNVDKLQTNHKGIFVLHDNAFSWVQQLEVDYRNEKSLDEAKKFLIVPCGLIRGSLSNLGVKSTVRAEFSTLPACFFNIQIHQEL